MRWTTPNNQHKKGNYYANTKPTNHQIIIKPYPSPLENIEEKLMMEKGITLAEFNKKRTEMEEAFRKATKEEILKELRKEKLLTKVLILLKKSVDFSI